MPQFRKAKLTIRGAVMVTAVAMCAAQAAADAQELPVPKVAIYPGDVIGADTLTQKQFSAAWAAKMPVYKVNGDIVGRVARRTLVPGQPIPLNATRVVDAVSQGKTYRIVYNESGLVISGTAVALTSGAVGDLVSLRNPDSGIVVRGIVHEDGTVRMSFK